MADVPSSNAADRLASLDVFRGITIAGMILVNNPGDEEHRYAPLRHAHWNGWTPTDLIFPSFVFIMGVSIVLSFEKRLAQGHSRAGLLAQVLRRTLMIFLFGLVLYGFPDLRLIGPYVCVIVGLALLAPGGDARPSSLALGEQGGIGAGRSMRPIIAWICVAVGVLYFALDFHYFQVPHPPATSANSPLRIPGVLQRIALCYFFASVIVLTFGPHRRVAWALLLLAGYAWIMTNLHSPVAYQATLPDRPEGWIHEWIDAGVFGTHVYREHPDPEGLLSTLPAIATALIGVLTGGWLRSGRDRRDIAGGLFVVAMLLLLSGLWLDHWLPINKKIWTPSYVLLAGGMSMHALAICYWIVDGKGYRVWTRAFEVFGTNAIVAYVASDLFGTFIAVREVSQPGGEHQSLWVWIYEHFFGSWASSNNASLAFAISYVLLWLVLLIPFYRRRMFIRV